MTSDQADQFADFIDGMWQPKLSEVARIGWTEIALPLDAKIAFGVVQTLWKTETRRPWPAEFSELYRHALRDATPVAPEAPEPRDEMPPWVAGWMLALKEGDTRLWPEMEVGSRQLHDEWDLETKDLRPMKDRIYNRSGYEWEANVKACGIMPAEVRAEFMRRARDQPDSGLAENVATKDLPG